MRTASASTANEQFTVWDANLQTPVSLGPLGGADVTVGRFGNQWTRYTLEQVDADIYTRLYQTDSGNMPTDGIKAVFKVGPIGLNTWAVQFKAIPFAQPWGGSMNGKTVNLAIPAGLQNSNLAAPITQGAGARATVGNPDNWVLGASAEQFGLGDHPVDAENGVAYSVLSVYEADFNGLLPFFQSAGITLGLNWTDSAEGSDSSSFNDVASGWKYQATDDQIGFSIGGLALKGGYQYVGPDFTAPGYWGRAGGWINPTNIQGPVASAVWKVADGLTVDGDYEDWQAAYDDENSLLQINASTGSHDKLTRYNADLAFGLDPDDAWTFGYEDDRYDLAAGDQTWSSFNLGLGHRLNKNSLFKVAYHFIANKYSDATAENADGNLLVGQFQTWF